MKHLLRRNVDVLIACGFAAVFAAWPQLDLMLAARLYCPGSGFVYGQRWWIHLIYFVMAKAWILVFVLAFLLLRGFLPDVRKRWRQRRTMLAYLLAVLVLGPGLLVNTVLKDHWGRPRPVHLRQFGGLSQFTPMLQPSDQCKRNCAFVSGHAAAGFYPIAGYWVTRRRRWLIGGIGLGLLVGYTRMAMGAHFLSDVLFAGVAVAFTCRFLFYAQLRLAAFSAVRAPRLPDTSGL